MDYYKYQTKNNPVFIIVQWFLQNLGADGLPRLISDWEDKSAAALCMFGYCEVEQILVVSNYLENDHENLILAHTDYVRPINVWVFLNYLDGKFTTKLFFFN